MHDAGRVRRVWAVLTWLSLKVGYRGPGCGLCSRGSASRWGIGVRVWAVLFFFWQLAFRLGRRVGWQLVEVGDSALEPQGRCPQNPDLY